jgi:hypothetical protein
MRARRRTAGAIARNVQTPGTVNDGSPISPLSAKNRPLAWGEAVRRRGAPAQLNLRFGPIRKTLLRTLLLIWLTALAPPASTHPSSEYLRGLRLGVVDSEALKVA